MMILKRKEIKSVTEMIDEGIFEYNGKEFAIWTENDIDPLKLEIDSGVFDYTSLSRSYYGEYREVGEDGMTTDDFESLSEIEKYLTDNEYEYVLVGCYEHGGISLYRASKKATACGFDDRPFGLIWKRRDRIRDGVKEWESNVEYFIRYWSKMLNGEIYVVKRYDDDDEHIEECEYHNIDKVFKDICGDHLKK